MVIDTLFIYHFVDLDRGVVIFFEVEVATEQGSVDFEIRDWSTFYIKLFEIKENCQQVLCFFWFFGTRKRKAFKSSLYSCTFMLWLLYYFNLPNYHGEKMESGKKMHSNTAVDAGGNLVVVLPKWRFVALGRVLPDRTKGSRKQWLFLCGTHY